MTSLPLLSLGQEFYTEVQPAPFPSSSLVYFNETWAQILGLGQSMDQIKKHFWSFEPLSENLPRPLAMKYHGHQFLHYNPQLGDGRGFTFAQFFNPSLNHSLLELGTKGSGTTPYSRRGDGRLTLKGAVREILATEYLEAMGVKTSKTIAVFETKEQLVRHDEPSPTRSAVLTRLSQGHIRFGTFQRLLTENKIAEIKRLTRYCLTCFYPELVEQDKKNIIDLGFEEPLVNEDVLIPRFFESAVQRHASLVASYMISGFVHGVLNTDNMNISGESFDYGPYRFLPTYDPNFTAAYFDHEGLYCFGRQPQQFLWNLDQLRQCLEPITTQPQILEKSLATFQDKFENSLLKHFFQRLRIKPRTEQENFNCLHIFYHCAQKTQMPLDQLFFDITRIKNRLMSIDEWLKQDSELKSLASVLENFESTPLSAEESAYFQNERPQTLLIDEIEKLWKTIDTSNPTDWSPLHEKITLMRSIPKTNPGVDT